MNLVRIPRPLSLFQNVNYFYLNKLFTPDGALLSLNQQLDEVIIFRRKKRVYVWGTSEIRTKIFRS